MQRSAPLTRKGYGELRLRSAEEVDLAKSLPCSEVSCANPNCERREAAEVRVLRARVRLVIVAVFVVAAVAVVVCRSGLLESVCSILPYCRFAVLARMRFLAQHRWAVHP